MKKIYIVGIALAVGILLGLLNIGYSNAQELLEPVEPITQITNNELYSYIQNVDSNMFELARTLLPFEPQLNFTSSSDQLVGTQALFKSAPVSTIQSFATLYGELQYIRALIEELSLVCKR